MLSLGSSLISPTILLYGDFAPDRLAFAYHRAFEQLGCRVIPVNTRDTKKYMQAWLRTRVGYRLTIRSLHLRALGVRTWTEHLLKTISTTNANLLFCLSSELLMPEVIRAARQAGMLTFIFNADDPFPPSPSSRPETLPIALEADCYLIWSRRLVSRLEDLGVSRVTYLPFAWDEEQFPYIEDELSHKEEIVFIGGWDKWREHSLAPIAKEFPLKVWGPDYWKTRTRPGSPLRACWQGKALRRVEAAKVIRNSKIVLNVLRQQNLPDGTNMRTFEAPGAGGFLLSNRSAGAQEIFDENIAGAYFGSTEEMMDRIDYFLRNASMRETIAREAHRIVDINHRYTHRAKDVIQLYFDLSG